MRSIAFRVFALFSIGLFMSGAEGCGGLCTNIPFFDAFFCAYNETPNGSLRVTPNPVVSGQPVVFQISSAVDPDGFISGSNIFPLGVDVGSALLPGQVSYVYDLPNGGTVHPAAVIYDNDGAFIIVTAEVTVLPVGEEAPPVPPPTRDPIPRNDLARIAFPASTVGKPFSLELDANILPGGRVGVLEQEGSVSALRNIRAEGRLKGKLSGKARRSKKKVDQLLRKLQRSKWQGKIDAISDDSNKTRHVEMLAVAKFPKRSKRSGKKGRNEPRSSACLRITLDDAPGGKPQGAFEVLGGTGLASRLRAIGNFGFSAADIKSFANGVVEARMGRSQPIPSQCRDLSK